MKKKEMRMRGDPCIHQSIKIENPSNQLGHRFSGSNMNSSCAAYEDHNGIWRQATHQPEVVKMSHDADGIRNQLSGIPQWRDGKGEV